MLALQTAQSQAQRRASLAYQTHARARDCPAAGREPQRARAASAVHVMQTCHFLHNPPLPVSQTRHCLLALCQTDDDDQGMRTIGALIVYNAPPGEVAT